MLVLSVVLLLLLGYGISRVLNHRHTGMYAVLCTAVLSAVLSVLSVLNTLLVRISCGVLLVIVYGVLLRKYSSRIREDLAALRNNRTHVVLLCCAILLVGVLTFVANPSEVPLHADEWSHLAHIQSSMELEGFSFVNPMLYYTPAHENFHALYHASLAFITLLGGSELFALLWMPILFAMLGALMLARLVFSYTQDRVSMYVSAALFAAIPTNGALLGPWLLVPVASTLCVLFFGLLVLHESKTRSWLWWVFGAVVLVSIGLYVFVSMLLVCVAVFVLWYRHPTHRTYLYSVLGGVLLLILLLVLVFGIEHTLLRIVFTPAFEGIYQSFNPLVLSPLLVLLAGYSLYARTIPREITWLILGLLVLLLVREFTSFSVLMPYRNATFYLLAVLIIPAGIAMSSQKKWLCVGVVVVAVCWAGWAASSHGFVELASDEELVGISVSEVGPGSVVLADPFLSATIYPRTQARVVSIVSAYLGGGARIDTAEFFDPSTSCERKSEIVREHEVSVVFSHQILECDFLEYRLTYAFIVYDVNL